MTTQFVAIRDGKEFDHVDPVLEIKETPYYWDIYNGYGWYKVYKAVGVTHEIRVLEEK